jgi:hypothetical protein
MPDCDVTIIGAGPYGLSAAVYLRAAGVEARVLGETMAFWENQMPSGMFLRSSWEASHIADPRGELTLDAYRSASGNHISAPVPLARFVEYGRWFQRQSVPQVEERKVTELDADPRGFSLTLADGERFTSRRVVIAVGIGGFALRPVEFDAIPRELASHSSAHKDLSRFKGKRVVVIGGGQSALESAALLDEAGAEVEVIARQEKLNWVGLHSWLHHLGLISKLLYSSRDVGPAGLSRIVSVPRLLRMFPREFRDRASYRSIRPAGSGWLRARLAQVPITLKRRVVSANVSDSQLRLTLDDRSERIVDHALLATGYRVDSSRYQVLAQRLRARLQTADGYPVLKSGMESSIPGLHFLGKPAAWSYGPLLGFVSGTEFASKELVRGIARKNGARQNG